MRDPFNLFLFIMCTLRYLKYTVLAFYKKSLEVNHSVASVAAVEGIVTMPLAEPLAVLCFPAFLSIKAFGGAIGILAG